MRRRRKDNAEVPSAADYLQRNYDRILSELSARAISIRFLEFDDLLHETVLYIMTDKHCETMKSDQEFISYFKYRFDMIRFQTTKDYHQELKSNADYQQAQKNSRESEW